MSAEIVKPKRVGPPASIYKGLTALRAIVCHLSGTKRRLFD